MSNNTDKSFIDKVEIYARANPWKAKIGGFVIWVLILVILFFFGKTAWEFAAKNGDSTYENGQKLSNPNPNKVKWFLWGLLGFIPIAAGIIIGLFGFFVGGAALLS